MKDKWIITNMVGDYWSNKLGWTGFFTYAEVYTNPSTVNLPIGGKWEVITKMSKEQMKMLEKAPLMLEILRKIQFELKDLDYYMKAEDNIKRHISQLLNEKGELQ